MTINFNLKAETIYKVLVVVLLTAILSLALWGKPWESSSVDANTRKITVTGEATVTAEPNEYTFSPYFRESSTDKEQLREDLVSKANEVVEKLKELGVEEKDIVVDASSYDYWYWDDGEEGTMTVSIQIKVTDNKDLVQEVQDYLVTTDSKGQLTPRGAFSEDRRKELDDEAYNKAAEDARAKAEARAKIFDAKLGKVISIDQAYASLFDDYGYDLINASVSLDSEAGQSLPVLQGENEYRQSVNVVYEIK